MTDLTTKEISLPADPKRKMRVYAAASGTTLGNLVASMVEMYATGGYGPDTPGIDITTIEDPGPQNTGRVKFKIDPDVWRAAAVRAAKEDTSISSVLRRASIALNR